MDPRQILFEHYPPDSPLTRTLLRHSEQVRDKALEVARKVAHLNPDRAFIAEAAMLHDIGIYRTAAAALGCRGDAPYIRHGIIGRRILEDYGLGDHALVCERHVGVGISRKEIQSRNLPLPHRDMLPDSLEEIIICYADKFFSKSNGGTPHRPDEIVAQLQPFGREQAARFMEWHRLFSG
ncbi:MAG: HD domain-containing protein [Desulfobacteraceae bacterium]